MVTPRERLETGEGHELRSSARAASDGDFVEEVLRAAIQRGALRPGTPLVQRDLAAALGVSRIPVRDALQTLLAEGLVTQAGRRLTVTELTPDDADELYSLRLLIEPALAPWIIANCTSSTKQRLRALVERMDDQKAANDQVGWAHTNHTFHETLYAAAQRPLFARMADQLLDLVESYSRMATMYLGGWDLSQEEHHVIVNSIDRADEATLRATLEVHLARAQNDLVNFMVKQGIEPRDVGEPEAELEAVFRGFIEAYGTSAGGDGDSQ